MSASTTAVDQDRERYIELSALDVMLSSSYALGGILSAQLRTIDFADEGFDLKPTTDGAASMYELYSSLEPDEPEDGDLAGQILVARQELLVSRLLRSIARAGFLEERADYYQRLGESKLAALADGSRSPWFPGEWMPPPLGSDNDA